MRATVAPSGPRNTSAALWALRGHLSLPLVTAAVTGFVLLRMLDGASLLTLAAAWDPPGVAANALDFEALAAIEPGAGPNAGDGDGGGEETHADAAEDHAPAASDHAAAPQAPPVIVQFRGPEELRDVAQNLARRQLQVEAREADLAVEAVALQTARDDLAADLARLDALKRRMEALTAEVDAEAAARGAQLVKLYESMKPKNAAAVLNRLTLDIVVPVLRDMREARAAAILQSMDPVKAALVTVELARAAPSGP